MYHRSDEKEIPKRKIKRKRTKEGEWKAKTKFRQHGKRKDNKNKNKYRKEICIVSSRTRHDTCVSHKLHPVYIVRTMICSYFGISFFEFAKNVYLQILYENIYRKKNWTWNIKYWNLVLELLTLSTKAWFSGGGPKHASTLSHPRESIPLWTRQPNRSFCSFTRSNSVDVRYLLMFCASRNRNSFIKEKITFMGEWERMRAQTRIHTWRWQTSG